MYYEEVGSGAPVLAVHGWAPDHRLMSGCLEPIFAARAGYRRLYPDLPAMGRSPVGTVVSSDDLLGELLAFIDDHIGAEPFVLVGGVLWRLPRPRHRPSASRAGTGDGPDLPCG